MSAGSKIKDDKQEYALSHGGPSYVSPSGHEIAIYDTEENERLVVKHASGSALEFKADGSVFIKAQKDLHLHSSPLSDQAGDTSGSAQGADATTMRWDADLRLECGGRLTIACKSFDLEVDNTTYIKTGTDYKLEANNIIHKSAEQGSYEATKTLYFDSKEKKERLTSHRVELGTEETRGGIAGGGGFEPVGGFNVINVRGNYVLENSDPSGGITISSAGYLNLVAGQERVDITGKWGPMTTRNAGSFLPGRIARACQATYANMIFDPTTGNPDPKQQYNAPPGTGGSYVTMAEGSTVLNTATRNFLCPIAQGNGHLVTATNGNKTEMIMAGNRVRNVFGNETVTIREIQRTTARLIFLN
jgi:hypothetical protein